jgi:thioesterase domain-containing protein/acyl carrier protein
MLRTGTVPANIHLVELNPEIDNSKCCFSFPTRVEQRDLRAIGVSSFGIGGTNAHAVLTRPVPGDAPSARRDLPAYLVPFSCMRPDDEPVLRSSLLGALDPAVHHLADAAFTLSTGRRQWATTRFAVVADHAGLLKALAGEGDDDPDQVVTRAGLLAQLSRRDLVALAGVLPAYSLCVHAVRSCGQAPVLDGDIYPAALLLLLRYLEAVDVVDDEPCSAQTLVVDTIYYDSDLLPDGTRLLAPVAVGPGSVGPGSEPAEDLARAGAALRLLYRCLAGVGEKRPLNLRALYAGLGVQRLALPGHPLARSRHWIDPPTTGGPGGPRMAPRGTDTGAGSGTDVGTDAGTDARQTTEREQPLDAAVVVDRVVALIADALEVPDAAADENYFELGGDSLQAIGILRRLNAIHDASITLEDFLSAATIGDVAALLVPPAAAVPVAAVPAAEVTSLPSFMPLIRAAGGPRVHAVHPAGGSTFCYRALARHLTSPCSLVGLDLPPDHTRMTDLPTLARFYADEVQRSQPEGRIALCGYSFGGNLAAEIAATMVADGREVAPLLLIDSFPSESYLLPGPSRESYWAMLPQVVRAYLPHGLADHGASEPSGADELERAAADAGLSRHEMTHFFDRWVYNTELLRGPASAAVPVDAVLVRTEIGLDPSIRARLNVADASVDLWRRRLLGHVEVVAVPGDHFTCMADAGSLRAVAAQVERWLRVVDDPGRRPPWMTA